jgi:ABC-type dipeptide/oligopeptide/nickel transport system permease component
MTFILVYAAFVVTSGLFTALGVVADLRTRSTRDEVMIWRSLVSSPLPMYVLAGVVIPVVSPDSAVQLLFLASVINLGCLFFGARKLRRTTGNDVRHSSGDAAGA